MTETKTTPPAAHEMPCFCEHCLPSAVMDLISERGKLLDAALRDRTYHDGYERELAEELIYAIPAAKRAEVLGWMLEWDHLQPRVMTVDCLLDECDDRTYKALKEMAAILLAAIHAQQAEGHALQVIVRNAIRQQQKLADAGRRYGWR